MTDIPIVGLPWPEPELPEYRAGSVGPWSIGRTPAMKMTAGYFLPAVNQPRGWVIKYEGKNVWMSLTRMEIESHMPHLAAAHGHTVVMGLGMGFALYNIAKNPRVTKVTLVEKSLDIVRLLDKTTKWRQWPGSEKVELVIADALGYVPDSPVDFLYADIWPLAGDKKALNQTQHMQKNIRAKLVGYWTQEYDYVHALTRGFGRDLYGYRRFAKEVNLPLIEQDNERYPNLAVAAVTLQIAAGEKDEEKRGQLFRVYGYLVTRVPRDPINRVLYNRELGYGKTE